MEDFEEMTSSRKAWNEEIRGTKLGESPREQEKPKPSLRELAKHPYLQIDPGRLGYVIRSNATFRKTSQGTRQDRKRRQCHGGKNSKRV